MSEILEQALERLKSDGNATANIYEMNGVKQILIPQDEDLNFVQVIPNDAKEGEFRCSFWEPATAGHNEIATCASSRTTFPGTEQFVRKPDGSLLWHTGLEVFDDKNKGRGLGSLLYRIHRIVNSDREIETISVGSDLVRFFASKGLAPTKLIEAKRRGDDGNTWEESPMPEETALNLAKSIGERSAALSLFAQPDSVMLLEMNVSSFSTRFLDAIKDAEGQR